MITSRRAFLKTAALGGASLIIGFDSSRLIAGAESKTGDHFKPNNWVTIDPHGMVTLTIGKSEMGQGVRTSLAMILAEELDADWSRIKLVQASPGPVFDDLGTGGSDSVRDGWRTLRKAGAAAREMLTSAAAARWKVDRANCAASNGAVVHMPTGRQFEYGALVGDAAKLSLPDNPPLKSASDYKIVGQRTPRIDGHDIVTGKAGYGIDVKIPGMLHASLERPPWDGAKPKGMQEDKARAVPGVHDVIKTSRGLAVIADSTWAAIKCRTALAVEWEDPPPDAFDSEAHAKRLEAASREAGFITRKEEPPAGTGAVAQTIEAIYHYPFYAHAPVETMNCVADVRGDRCTIWVGTQAPNKLQKQVAELLGTMPDKVEVNVTLIGGGFGRRLAVEYGLEAAEISRAAKVPVQLLWSRQDDMKHGHFQAASAHCLTAGFDAQGNAVAWKHTKAGSFHNISPLDPKEVHDAAWYVFAREAFVDEMAQTRGADPLEYRLDLLEGADIVKPA